MQVLALATANQTDLFAGALGMGAACNILVQYSRMSNLTVKYVFVSVLVRTVSGLCRGPQNRVTQTLYSQAQLNGAGTKHKERDRPCPLRTFLATNLKAQLNCVCFFECVSLKNTGTAQVQQSTQP